MSGFSPGFVYSGRSKYLISKYLTAVDSLLELLKRLGAMKQIVCKLVAEEVLRTKYNYPDLWKRHAADAARGIKLDLEQRKVCANQRHVQCAIGRQKFRVKQRC